MTITSICVGFIVALLGIAFPLMLQVITRIEEKYKSVVVSKQLRKELSWRFYKFFLVGSLVIVLLYILNNYLSGFCNISLFILLDQLIIFLLVISTSVLVASFIILVKKLLIYGSITSLIDSLIKKDRGTALNDDNPHFAAISDILIQSIREYYIDIVKVIYQYCNEAFQRYRDLVKNGAIEYPSKYYELVNRVIEELILMDGKRIPFLEYRTAGSIWLLGESKGYKIHETTYRWLWKNLSDAIEGKKDDFIIQHWETADQYVSYNLSTTFFEDEEDLPNVRQERERFLEFHHALGGYLLYRNMYDVIRRMFRFTRSQPPRFELLPNNMTEIFKYYIEFCNPHDMSLIRIPERYYFPDIDGIINQNIIKNWVGKYFALLFLRQYTIVPYLITMRPLDMPNLPDNQRDRKRWINSLGYFQSYVESILGDNKLLQATQIEFLTNDWCNENDKLYPTDYVNKIIEDVKSTYSEAEMEQELSEVKVREFYDYSRDKLTQTMSLYEPLNNVIKPENGLKNWYIHGSSVILDRMAFLDNQDRDYIDYDKHLADSVSNKYQNAISEVFFHHVTKRYLIRIEEMPDAVKNLDLNSNDHIIVAFGVSPFYFKNILPDFDESTNSLNGIQTLIYQKCNNHLAGETIFVLSKNDLPSIKYLEIDNEMMKKYDFKKVNDEFNIYLSITDLNKNEDILKEEQIRDPNLDLNRSLLLQIAFNTNIIWKKEMKMIALKIYSEYRRKGVLNNPNEIKKM